MKGDGEVERGESGERGMGSGMLIFRANLLFVVDNCIFKLDQCFHITFSP